jgi:glycosyltransferase involved in cell wall biosynthesis
MPKVSVIVPTFNRAECLSTAITSILNQTFTDLEIIVVDDASQDHTPDILRTFSANCIKYIRHERNKGGSAARNTGIVNASSDYIAFLDDDDEWLPDKLRKQVEVLDRSSADIGAVYTGFVIIERSTGRTIREIIPTKKGNLAQELFMSNCIGGTSLVVVRKRCFTEVGVFDENLPCFQDYDLWLRIAQKFEFDYIQEPLMKYYRHDYQIWTNLEAIDKGLEILIQKYGQSVKKRCSNHYLRLGHRYCLRGDMKKGRRAFVNAITLCPFGTLHYLNYLLSLFGAKGFKNLKQSKRQVFASLKRYSLFTHQASE